MFPLVKDSFVQECELLRSDLLQQDMDVEGQFASEEWMRTEWKWSEKLACLNLFL